jgi:hypothetical protein
MIFKSLASLATLFFALWPGLLLEPAQREIFFSQNVRPVPLLPAPSPTPSLESVH